MASLKPQKSDIHETMAAFEPIFAALGRRLQSLEDNDKAKDDCIKDLQQKNKELESKLNQVEAATARLTSVDLAISALEAKSKSLANILQKVQKSNHQQKASIDQLNQKMKPLFTEISRLTNLQRLLNQLYTKVTDKNESSQEVLALQGNQSTTLTGGAVGTAGLNQKEMAYLSEKVDVLQAEHNTLTEKTEEIEKNSRKDVASLNGQINTKEKYLLAPKKWTDLKSKRRLTFSAEHSSSVLLLPKQNEWYKLDKQCNHFIVPNPNFNQHNSTFTTPLSGIYAISVEIKQSGDGELEARLLGGGEVKYYFGRTFRAKHQHCGQCFVELKQNDVLSLAGICYSGEAKIAAYVFSGWLIEEL